MKFKSRSRIEFQKGGGRLAEAKKTKTVARKKAHSNLIDPQNNPQHP